jgi:hypothetical protein
MPDPFSQRISWNAALVLTSAAFLVLSACRKSAQHAASAPDSPGQTVVFSSISKTVDAAALQNIRWQDIAPTVESCSRNQLTEQTLAATAAMTESPVIYLRGLLKFTVQDLDGAAAEWAKIEASQIPPDPLYAPWRLAAVKNESPNRYEAAMVAAVKGHKTNPLISARYHGSKDQWREALEAYLQTNPSTWSTYEIRLFAALKLQAPYTHDTSVMIAGALNGGQVPDSLRGELARLIKGSPIPDTEALKKALDDDPVLAKAALDSATRSLSIRQAFASNQFQKVTEIIQPIAPLDATDEIVMLAFLSHAQLKNTSQLEIWAEELLRRNPTETNRKWIATIRAEAL